MTTASIIGSNDGVYATHRDAHGHSAHDLGDSDQHHGRGALVLYPGERFRGREIEISSLGGHGHRVHTGVHERTTDTQSMLTAVFGSLPVGEYVVWEDATTEGPVVSVPDGAVAEVRLD